MPLQVVEYLVGLATDGVTLLGHSRGRCPPTFAGRSIRRVLPSLRQEIREFSPTARCSKPVLGVQAAETAIAHPPEYVGKVAVLSPPDLGHNSTAPRFGSMSSDNGDHLEQAKSWLWFRCVGSPFAMYQEGTFELLTELAR